MAFQSKTSIHKKLTKSLERWHKRHLTDLNSVSHQKQPKIMPLWKRKSLELLKSQSIFKSTQLDLLKNGSILMIKMNSLKESISLSEKSIPSSWIKRPQTKHIPASSREEKLILHQDLTRWSKTPKKFLELILCQTLVMSKQDQWKCMNI